ncbi:MAG: 4-alpha-glucanotransferase [Candidatus Margulisbacteria bacterium]|nr:4-alpha-glucanotransferase [Candidatus Margulisiibacteriota bacterium]
MITKRGSGILLHITSLPSQYGIGDLGSGAYQFADFLAQTGQSFWQVLPLNPTDQASGNSPYSNISAYAGNTLLISPELLIEDGLLGQRELENSPDFPEGRCDYSWVIPYKNKILESAYLKFRQNGKFRNDYENYCANNVEWLDNYALFVVIKKHFGGKAWSDWDHKLRDRDAGALKDMRKEFAAEVEKEKFLQYLFFKQWFALKKYCNDKGVQLVGDIPIYVNYDSVSVWVNPELFKLGQDKRPAFVAGVPPDYFSQTGQLWGNPVYRWEALQKTGYDWWQKRIEHNLKFVDILRLDHFRGFVAYWEVPVAEKTAVRGHWEKAPAEEFFATLKKHIPNLPLIAEDLGLITKDVKDVMKQFDFPGMRVLQFAFYEDKPDHPYLPQNYIENCVVYTGTHDNNTTKGWFENETNGRDRERISHCLGHGAAVDNIHWELVTLAMKSIAKMAVFPMQDILGLGAEARMNVPGVPGGNWEWRLLPSQLSSQLIEKLLGLTKSSSR